MADYLYDEIQLFVTVVNVSSDPAAIYGGSALGGNLAPSEFLLNPKAQQVTQGTISIPNAELGAQGEFSLEDTLWEVTPKNGQTSRVVLIGTVTYVTVEDTSETTTTQTINVTPQVSEPQIPISLANVQLIDRGTPTALLTMNIFAGSVNPADGDKKADQAAVNNQESFSMKRVITQKKEKDTGDKA
ncbi:uncharacterized protein FMAN_07032 [Fusarium mangiferae]|uniref:Uncharacterized protein n=1 Tax=Fusarium mangiferae TaxID=192010 RepID=A0A1L7T9U1_FUSMA|nr:uncharacterized protein FMAN_07032 [Fusarium mangiferae]CVK92007.1 uncharacterized protein FMAN_07032 [Fusarium mangiferae]